MASYYVCPECGARAVWTVYQAYEGCPECRLALDALRSVEPAGEW